MATVYAVDVNVNLMNGGGGGGGGNILNMAQLNQMNVQFNTLNQTINRVQQSSQGLANVWTKMFIARELMHFGEAALGMFGRMISAAADFQTAMGKIQMSTGATTLEMDMLQKAVVNISETHAMDLSEAANMIAISSRGGIKDPKQLLALLDPSSAGLGDVAGISDFVDVMRLSHGMGTDQSSKMGMEFATLLGGQDPKSILKALDEFTRASSFSPGGPGEIFETFRKLHPIASKLGADTKQELQISALLGEAGLEGAGGRETASALLKMATGKGVGRGHGPAAAELDKVLMASRTDGGGLDLIKMVSRLQQFEQQNPKTALATEKEAFGQVGLRALAVLSDPKHVAQLEHMVSIWDKMPGLQEQHRMQMDQFNAQLKVTTTDLAALGATAAGPLLSALTPLLKGLNSVLEHLTKFLQEHHAVLGAVAGGVGVAAIGAAGTVGTTGMLLTSALAQMAARTATGATAGALTGVAAGSAGLAGSIAAISAVVVPAALAIVAIGAIVDAAGEYVIRNRGGGTVQLGATGKAMLDKLTPEQRKSYDAGDMTIHVQGGLHVHASNPDEMHKGLVKHLSRNHTGGLWQGSGPGFTPATNGQ